jgi:hypothetical protein
MEKGYLHWSTHNMMHLYYSDLAIRFHTWPMSRWSEKERSTVSDTTRGTPSLHFSSNACVDLNLTFESSRADSPKPSGSHRPGSNRSSTHFSGHR